MKRFIYIVAVVLVSLLIVAGLGMALLLDSDVQTAAVRVVTEELSRALGTHAKIGTVNYKFPMRLSLDTVYLEDQQGDTLLYIEEAYAHLRPRALRKGKVEFRQVRLRNAYLNAYTLPDSTKNYDFLLRAFATQQDTAQQTPTNLIFGAQQIDIENIRVRYDEWQGQLATMEVAVNVLSKEAADIRLQRLMGQVSKGGKTMLIEDMRVAMQLNDSIAYFPTLYARMPDSKFDLSGLRFSKADTVFHMHINEARLSPKDIGLFVPVLSKIDYPIEVQGDLSGKGDSVSLMDFQVHYNSTSVLKGNITAAHLNHKHQATIHANLQDLFINARIAQDFFSDMEDKPIRLPEIVHRLGNLHYKGLLSGKLIDMKLQGAFRTALGTVSTDGRLMTDTIDKSLAFTGKIGTKKFHLGRLTGNSDLGTVKLTIEGNARIDRVGVQDGKAGLQISEITYKGYTYRNITLAGQFKNYILDAVGYVRDENVRLILNGLFDFDKEVPEVDVNMVLERLHMQPLNLSDKYHDSDIRGQLSAHVVGKRLNDMIGFVRMNDLFFRNGRDSVKMEELELTMANENGRKMLKMTGDYAAFCLKGQYDYSTLLTTLEKGAMMYLPEIFTEEERARVHAIDSRNDVDFYLYGRQIHELQRALALNFFISDYPVIKGYMHESQKLLGIQAYVPYVRLRQGDARDITLSVHNNDDRGHMALQAGWYDSQYTLQTTFRNNEVAVDLVALDSAKMELSHVQANGVFSRYKGLPVVDIQTQPGFVNIADSTFFISNSNISYVAADTVIRINDFRFGSASQFLNVDGVASPRENDSLHIELNEIQVNRLLKFILAEGTLTAGGWLSGEATIHHVLNKPQFNVNVTLDSAELNETYIGDAVAKVYLEDSTKHLIIDADVVEAGRHVAHVDGRVPGDGKWDLVIEPDSFNLGFIGHWTDGFLSNIGGRGDGIVHVFGEGGNTYVLIAVKPREAQLTIPFTGCTYHFNDSVYMDSTRIIFKDMHLWDDEGNPVHLDAEIRHNHFQDFNFDIDVRPERALVVDLPMAPGELLQGKVYANGRCQVTGRGTDIFLKADATTVGNSQFRMSFGGASNAANNDFITFVNHNAIAPMNEEKARLRAEEDRSFLNEKRIERNGDPSHFHMQLDLNVTPEAEIQLVLNEQTGDMLKGRGDGGLRLTFDALTGDLKLMGNYELINGKLGFTLGNLVRREFTMAEGSRVVWVKDAANPELNVTATYRVTASLKDLFGSEINNLATTRTSVPVDCNIYLTGPITNPTIRFGIELPNSESLVRQQVQSIINTDEMLMRQMVYLLVFGRFFTPEYLATTTDGMSSLNATYSFLSSTLTSQINNWIGKITNSAIFSVGVAIRSEGYGATDSQEYEANFQVQPVNRLLINGNIGYRYNDITNRPVFGDLDIEYMITPNGKFRVKAYTHTVDKYSLRSANTQQGVGFVFKHDFNWKKDKE